MSETDDSNENETPETTEAAAGGGGGKKKAKKRAKRQPKLTKPKESGETILVYSKLPQLRRTIHREYTGYNEEAKQEEFINHTLEIKPGLNRVSLVLWEMCSSYPGLSKNVREGDVDTLENMSGSADFHKARPKRILPFIRETADVELLKELAEGEKRMDVLEALRMQIERCDHQYKAQENARRQQRAHNRRTK